MLTAAAHASLDIDGDRPGSWRRGFEADGLVVAATADPEVNASIARACASGGIPVSVASGAERSTFFFPAVCESSRLVAGVVSRGGASHELVARAAAGVRRTLEEVDHDA